MSEQVYTQEEIELNRKLYEECLKKEVDFSLVEEYLRQGADPLGPTEVGKWEDDHLYGELICGLSDERPSKNLVEITKIFLKNGMDISKPRVPYDGEGDSTNPLWWLAHCLDKYGIQVLHLLLESGVDADSIGQFWTHAAMDIVSIYNPNPNETYYKESATWMMKMIMLCASYPHILDADDDLKDCICHDFNRYDLQSFRDWDDFRYVFDDSLCKECPNIQQTILRIYKKGSRKEVWRMGFTKEVNDYLRENPING